MCWIVLVEITSFTRGEARWRRLTHLAKENRGAYQLGPRRAGAHSELYLTAKSKSRQNLSERSDPPLYRAVSFCHANQNLSANSQRLLSALGIFSPGRGFVGSAVSRRSRDEFDQMRSPLLPLAGVSQD